MSPILRLLQILCPVLLLLLGLAHLVKQLVFRIGPAPWRQSLIEWMEAVPPISIAALWSLGIAVPVFLVILSWRKFLILKTEAGHPLKIRESAVSRYLHDRLIRRPFVKAVRVSACVKRGGLAITARRRG